MQRLDIDELASIADTFDAAVAKSPDIDRFCSSSCWVLSAAATLLPPGESWLYRMGDCFLAAMQRDRIGLRCIEGLESSWGLACPLVGPDPRALAQHIREICRIRRDDWDLLLLSGIPRSAALAAALRREFERDCLVRIGPTTARHVADLRGGVDGFLRRRSRNFRRTAARSRRSAAACGIRFERCSPTDVAAGERIYSRILAVESRSWKGLAGTGLASPEMRGFYRLMVRRLAARGRQRTIFARHAGRDVAYILGGVFGTTYRGLQFSFNADYSRISLGTACQLEQIADLCAEGVTNYDLGTGMEYKLRWADRVAETSTILVANPHTVSAT